MTRTFRKKMKRAIEMATAIALGVVCAQLLDVFPFSSKSDRRFLVYSIQRQLRAGQSRADVEAVIKTHMAPFLHRHELEDGILLRADTGLSNAVLLRATFEDGRLVSARIRGEDGPHERFDDAPPDIVETKPNQAVQ